MAEHTTFDVIIIGGGLAGLTCALHLSLQGVAVLLIEKHGYPHHKVCGEYVSNEVLPYLKLLGINPFSQGACAISKLQMSTKKGRLLTSELPLGGFGISRYAMEQLFYEKTSTHATFAFDTAEKVTFISNHFTVQTQTGGTYVSPYLIGAFGKRSAMDIHLDRPFIHKRSPWLGVKAHYEYAQHPEDTVALHHFDGGYCGLSKIETGAVNACYLATSQSFKRAGSIEAYEAKVLSENPFLKDFFQHAKPLFKKPLTISQISFQPKKPVVGHIFMIGDSAGLIHPLCGNGMAMAIHSAKLFSEIFLKARENGQIQRNQLESKYEAIWNRTFLNRLRTGRVLQKVLLNPTTASMGLSVARHLPFAVYGIIKQTHGKPF